MVSFSFFLPTLFFSTAFAAPASTAGPLDTSVTSFNPDTTYVEVFNRDLSGTYCGAQLRDLTTKIDGDIKHIVSSIEGIITDILTLQACNCKLEGDIIGTIQGVVKLIEDLVTDIGCINWSCVTISLCFTIGNTILQLLNIIVKFLGCVLTYALNVTVEIEAEVWQIIFSVPKVIVSVLEEICGAVYILRLIIWVAIANIKAAIDALLPHCGCASPL